MKRLIEKKWGQYLIAFSILLIGAALSFLILQKPWSGERYQVTFYGFDGQIEKRCKVREGRSVFPPASDSLAQHGTYIFRGWDRALYRIQSDLEVYPQGIEIGQEKNLVYADSVYAKSSRQISITPTISGSVDCSSFIIEIGYDKELLDYVRTEPILKGVWVEEPSPGILRMHWSSETPVTDKSALASVKFKCLDEDSAYKTTVPFLVREIKTIKNGSAVYTDATAYDSELYIYK